MEGEERVREGERGVSLSGYCLIHNYIFIMTKLQAPYTVQSNFQKEELGGESVYIQNYKNILTAFGVNKL